MRFKLVYTDSYDETFSSADTYYTYDVAYIEAQRLIDCGCNVRVCEANLDESV